MSISLIPEKSTRHTPPQAAQAFVDSARQALGPIKATLKGLRSIKIHELPNAERHKHELLRSELEEFARQLGEIYREAAYQHDWADYIVRHVLRLKDEFDIKAN